jgi:hypothetical protein
MPELVDTIGRIIEGLLENVLVCNFKQMAALLEIQISSTSDLAPTGNSGTATNNKGTR